MGQNGRSGGAPGKGNPGGERGGNRGHQEKLEERPRGSSQFAGKDPQRGKEGPDKS